MSGRNNTLKSNGCIYVNPNGQAGFTQASLAGATFSKVGGPEATVNLGSAEGIPGAGDFGEQVDSTAKAAHKRTGLAQHLSDDIGHTKDFGSSVAGIMSGKNAQAAKDMGVEADAIGDLKKAGSQYLEGMGRGNKTLGAAKVGAYMVGASMLVDMLNPFSD